MMTRWKLTDRQFTSLLAATTLGVYILIATGATLAASELGTCTQWPLCLPESGSQFDVASLVVFGHRAMVAVVGVLLALTLGGMSGVSLDWRARVSLFSVAIVFPLQIALGGVVVLTDVSYVPEMHLLLGAAVFVLLLTALAWSLETDTKDSASDARSVRAPDSVTEAESQFDAFGDNNQVSTATTQSTSIQARIQAYLELTKPRLMWLLCLLALAGMALATTTGNQPTGVDVTATLAGGVLAIGASGTFNHLYERDRDRKMNRTADRPVATNEIPARNAALFGFAQVLLSMGILLVFVNVLAAALTLTAIIYYSVVYTVVLKPNTTWNIAIGGGSGALPALIGWAAVTGSIGLGGLLLAGLVVIWTPPHFYNLGIAYRDDYARAGYPMFPVVNGVSAARRRILLTLGATLLTSIALIVWTPLTWLFAGASMLAGAVFFWSAVSQCRIRTRDATMQTFFVSIAYLGVVLAAIVIETVVILP
jgi:protoheme IX farnesyltransferase